MQFSNRMRMENNLLLAVSTDRKVVFSDRIRLCVLDNPSQEFRDFAATNEFELVTRSPNYPQSNGHIENVVKKQQSSWRRNPSKQEPTFYFFFIFYFLNK